MRKIHLGIFSQISKFKIRNKISAKNCLKTMVNFFLAVKILPCLTYETKITFLIRSRIPVFKNFFN